VTIHERETDHAKEAGCNAHKVVVVPARHRTGKTAGERRGSERLSLSVLKRVTFAARVPPDRILVELRSIRSSRPVEETVEVTLEVNGFSCTVVDDGETACRPGFSAR
jgi:hypothetical protein